MIKPLTTLRFVFALMVFMSHCIIFDKSLNPFLYHLFKEGYVGVNFFFILSGFILAYTYQHKFVKNTISKSSFYIARFARIYPLHILTLLIWLYMRKDYPLNETYLISVLSNIFLIQSFYPLTEMRFNLAAWSLSDEMFFYLLFPFIIQWLVKVRLKLYAIFISCTLIVLILCSMFGGIENEEWLFYYFPPIRILDFILGIFLYNLCKSIDVDKLKKRYNPTIVEIFSILFFIAFYTSAYSIPHVYRHALWYWLPIGLIISVFYFQAGYISKILSNKRFIYLGEISFAFYLFHPIVLWYTQRVFSLVNITPSKVVIFVLAASLTIIVSSISFKYFETPANKWIKAKLNSKK